MKQLLVSGIILAACFSGESVASCSDPQVIGVTLSNLITGNTVCASLGSDQWQEQHRNNGELWDYKLGTSHAIDPSKQVGTWEILPRSNRVQYNYGAAGTFAYSVHGTGDIGTAHSFCGSVQIHNAILKAGQTSCP